VTARPHKTGEAAARRFPKRIQRKRIKGWRMPEGAMYVGRGSIWGNPHDWRKADPDAGPPAYLRGVAVDLYRDWLRERAAGGLAPDLTRLRGHDLACWCPLDHPCHADVLLELANA
jgi:Domain of unknown function (DUF4326)